MKFLLNDTVRITVSLEEGYIIGRAEYLEAGPTYLVRYCAADGRAVEAWWAETALTVITP